MVRIEAEETSRSYLSYSPFWEVRVFFSPSIVNLRELEVTVALGALWARINKFIFETRLAAAVEKS